jgi:hypothetical protein
LIGHLKPEYSCGDKSYYTHNSDFSCNALFGVKDADRYSPFRYTMGGTLSCRLG